MGNDGDLMDLPKTRAEALERGLTRYFTGKPCRNGHVAEWNIRGLCVTCAREYHQQYRTDNEERLRKHKAEYHKANAEHVRAKARRWAADNPERHKENLQRTYEASAHKFKARARQWAAANPEKMQKCRQAYKTSNPDALRADLARRRATKLQATPKWLTSEQKAQIADIYKEAVLAEQLTGVKHHVDHIEPLQGKDRRGLHVPWNLQVLEARENISKGNRAIETSGAVSMRPDEDEQIDTEDAESDWLKAKM